MNTPIQIEEQETNLQERDTAALTDESLPAEEILAAQSDDVEEISAPRFIP